jgi:hypothetical protein
MTPQLVTSLPLGFDEQTIMTLTTTNDIMIEHPVRGTMIYDETVMRWVEIELETIHVGKTD